jgi:Tol biopolymer transport system component
MMLAGIAAVALLLLPVAVLQAQRPTPRRLTNIINSYPDPSPDGSQVLFQSNRTGRWEVYRMDVDGDDPVQLTDEAGDNVTPIWSPDGSQIAFAASPDGNSDIFVMRATVQAGSGSRTTPATTRTPIGRLTAPASYSILPAPRRISGPPGPASGTRSSA